MNLLKLLTVYLLLYAGTVLEAASETAHVYETVEISFSASHAYDNAYMDVDLWVDLEGPGNRQYRIPAFWDGGQTWRARLAATVVGSLATTR